MQQHCKTKLIGELCENENDGWNVKTSLQLLKKYLTEIDVKQAEIFAEWTWTIYCYAEYNIVW